MKQKISLQITKRVFSNDAYTCFGKVKMVTEGDKTLEYTYGHDRQQTDMTECTSGNVEQELSYDAWGNLRDPDTWSWCVDATIRPMLDRGYTGHEHLPNLGLINMNGRMYDPVMSSFLSVDRYVQDPSNSQGFNRYAYCMYNPLRFTDPTGWQMIGGNRPRNPFHDDWSVSHVQPVFEPSDFRNAYHLVNQAFWSEESMNGIAYGDYFQSAADFYKGDNPSAIWFGGSLAGNYILNPSTFNRRELLDIGVKDFTYSTWWTESGYGGYQMNLTYDFRTYSYGDDNYYYGYKCYSDAIIGGKDLSRKNSDLGLLGGMINVGGLYTMIESGLHYNETFGFWQGKNGKFYGLHVPGNGSTGGKLKYGRAVSNSFRKASSGLNAIGIGISVVEMTTATTVDDKIKFGADIGFGVLGFAPGGTIISTFWFFGGRELVFRYGESVGELMKYGINPGLPAYQPFK